MSQSTVLAESIRDHFANSVFTANPFFSKVYGFLTYFYPGHCFPLSTLGIGYLSVLFKKSLYLCFLFHFFEIQTDFFLYLVLL
jgi:hypothetical protein